jgi:hypothetical protein
MPGDYWQQLGLTDRLEHAAVASVLVDLFKKSLPPVRCFLIVARTRNDPLHGQVAAREEAVRRAVPDHICHLGTRHGTPHNLEEDIEQEGISQATGPGRTDDANLPDSTVGAHVLEITLPSCAADPGQELLLGS